MHMGFGFSLIASIYLVAIYFPHFIFIANYIPKNIKTVNLLFLLSCYFANQDLQLLVGSTTFFLLRGTTIDLLHLGAIGEIVTEATRASLCNYHRAGTEAHNHRIPPRSNTRKSPHRHGATIATGRRGLAHRIVVTPQQP
jgi:hypothetical protein